MFLLGASKNIGAKPLADAVAVVIEVIRIIMKREHLVADPHTLRFSPCTGLGASERAGCHEALVAAARAVRGCFDQLDLDARRASTSLSRYSMASKGSLCSNLPDFQGGPDPTLRSGHVPTASDMCSALSRPSTHERNPKLIALHTVQSK